MSDAMIESRLSHLEAAQALHEAWFRRMEQLQEESARGRERERAERGRERAERAESERRLQESRAEAERRLRESRAEDERQLRESRARADRELQALRAETDRLRRENEREDLALRRQLAALGDKFGGFAEGMALPSMERRLRERFGTTTFAPSLRSRRGGEEMELDALGYTAGGDGIAVVVEVKSRLRADGIDQILRTLARFPRFYPEHAGKKLIGVLAAVEVPPELRERVLREGLVLATIHDDLFDFQVPAGFEPRAFPNPAAPN